MSFANNFGFSNYDRSAKLAGPGTTSGAAFNRRPSQAGEEIVSESTRRTSFSRRNTLESSASRKSEEAPGHRRARSNVANPATMKAQDATPGTEKPTISETEPEKIEPVATSSTEEHAEILGKPDSATSEEDEDEEEARQETVLRLARSYTRASSLSYAGNPFDEAERGGAIDPTSPHFNARAWVKSMLKLAAEDPDLNPKRVAGFVCRDLNVHGYGDATDYQKSVSNVWLDGVGLVRKVLGVRQRRIDILQNFDMLVEPGELLVVLGPPGSGCTTLLKTIAGETHGIYVDPNSYINYQGEL